MRRAGVLSAASASAARAASATFFSASEGVAGFSSGFAGVAGAVEVLAAAAGVAVGVGIGAGIGALIGASALDFTGGILAGLTLGSLGLFVLPNKRLQAHRQLRQKIAELREALERIVRREYEREQERADARLRDAISPYTRFTEQEQARLAGAQVRAAELREELEALQGEVGALR